MVDHAHSQGAQRATRAIVLWVYNAAVVGLMAGVTIAWWAVLAWLVVVGLKPSADATPPAAHMLQHPHSPQNDSPGQK